MRRCIFIAFKHCISAKTIVAAKLMHGQISIQRELSVHVWAALQLVSFARYFKHVFSHELRPPGRLKCYNIVSVTSAMSTEHALRDMSVQIHQSSPGGCRMDRKDATVIMFAQRSKPSQRPVVRATTLKVFNLAGEGEQQVSNCINSESATQRIRLYEPIASRRVSQRCCLLNDTSDLQLNCRKTNDRTCVAVQRS